MRTAALSAGKKTGSGGPELKRAMLAARAIARATEAAVRRHAQLDESVAIEADGKVVVVPAKTLVRQWQRSAAAGRQRRRGKP